MYDLGREKVSARSGSEFKGSQSVSQLFHGPAPRSPLHRLAVRLRHSRSNTSHRRGGTVLFHGPCVSRQRVSLTCARHDLRYVHHAFLPSARGISKGRERVGNDKRKR